MIVLAWTIFYYLYICAFADFILGSLEGAGGGSYFWKVSILKVRSDAPCGILMELPLCIIIFHFSLLVCCFFF